MTAMCLIVALVGACDCCANFRDAEYCIWSKELSGGGGILFFDTDCYVMGIMDLKEKTIAN